MVTQADSTGRAFLRYVYNYSMQFHFPKDFSTRSFNPKHSRRNFLLNKVYTRLCLIRETGSNDGLIGRQGDGGMATGRSVPARVFEITELRPP